MNSLFVQFVQFVAKNLTFVRFVSFVDQKINFVPFVFFVVSSSLRSLCTKEQRFAEFAQPIRLKAARHEQYFGLLQSALAVVA